MRGKGILQDEAEALEAESRSGPTRLGLTGPGGLRLSEPGPRCKMNTASLPVRWGRSDATGRRGTTCHCDRAAQPRPCDGAPPHSLGSQPGLMAVVCWVWPPLVLELGGPQVAPNPVSASRRPLGAWGPARGAGERGLPPPGRPGEPCSLTVSVGHAWQPSFVCSRLYSWPLAQRGRRGRLAKQAPEHVSPASSCPESRGVGRGRLSGYCSQHRSVESAPLGTRPSQGAGRPGCVSTSQEVTWQGTGR